LTDRLPHTLLGRFHPEVRWVVGRTKACVEGCRENSEAIQEMLYNDYQGRGGWTLVCGSGFEGSDLDALPVPKWHNRVSRWRGVANQLRLERHSPA
jgi:hypothetical protein